MAYGKSQLERDLSFAQELLNRMGLGDFKVMYKPSDVHWHYWHKYLSADVIHDQFERIGDFNARMNNGKHNSHAEESAFYEEKLQVMNEILDFIGKEKTLENYCRCYSGFYSSAYLTELFVAWHKNREAKMA